MSATAVVCLETKVNWCSAIRDKVAFYGQEPVNRSYETVNNDKPVRQQLQLQRERKVDREEKARILRLGQASERAGGRLERGFLGTTLVFYFV